MVCYGQVVIMKIFSLLHMAGIAGFFGMAIFAYIYNNPGNSWHKRPQV